MAVYDDQKQKTSDDELDKIVSPEVQAEIERTARDNETFDEMMRQEGLYKPEGDDEDGGKKSKNKLSPDELQNAESTNNTDDQSSSRLKDGAGKVLKTGLTAASPTARILLALKPNSKKKKAGLAGILVSMVIFVISLVVTPLLGPLAWISFAENLGIYNFTDQANLSAGRSIKMMKWIFYKHDTAKTRLGFIGNNEANKVQAAMEKNGFELQYDKLTGNFKGFKFDPKTATEGKYTGLENADPATVKTNLSSTLGVNEAKIRLVDGAYFIDPSNINSLANHRLMGRVYGASTDEGLALSAIQKRFLNHKVGVSWNPLTTLKSSAQQAAVDKYRSIREDRSKQLTGTEPTADVTAQSSEDEQGNPDSQSAKDAASGNDLAAKAKAGTLTKGALDKTALGLGFVCVVKTVADTASVANKVNTIRVSLEAANEVQAVASKDKDGKDVDPGVQGVYNESLYSKTTGSAMNANTIHFETGSQTTGVKLPPNLDPSGQQNAVSQKLDSWPGLTPVCTLINNKFVSIVATLASGEIGIAVTAFFASPAGTAIFQQITSLFESGIPDLSQAQYDGGVFGEAASLGTRLMANETSLSMGGRILNDNEESQLDTSNEQIALQTTKQQSVADRYLNPHVSTSLASRLIGNIDPNSPVSSFGSIVSGLTSSLPSSLLHLVSPSAYAASSEPKSKVYYGIPKVAFTQAEDDADPNPEANADKADDILTGPQGQQYQDLLKKCNNVTATFDNGMLDFVPGVGLTTNYNGEGAIPDDCRNDNDPNFVIIRNAVYDTLNAKSLACLDFDDEASCNDITGAQSGPTTPPQQGGGSATINPQGWTWPIHKEDLGNQAAGLTQCWLPYYAPKSGYHAALDIGVNYKPVYAAHNGTVVTKASDGYNTFIIDTGVDPDDSSRHLYAVYEHMSAFVVNVGDTVTAGQLIGTSGEVGAPGAPHLHFGISDSAANFGTYADPWHTANPLDYLPADYSDGLEKTDSESCKTADVKGRADFGFTQYHTLGTFNAYK